MAGLRKVFNQSLLVSSSLARKISIRYVGSSRELDVKNKADNNGKVGYFLQIDVLSKLFSF